MKLEIFDKYSRKRIEIIKVYNYASYSEQIIGRGSFEIRIPILDNIVDFLEEGNYILFEEGVVGIIKRRHTEIDEEETFIISGYLTNHFFEYRSFLVTHEYYDYFSNISKQMVNDLIVNPEDLRRKISCITISDDEKYFPIIGKKVRYQKTGSTLLNALNELLLTYNYGCKLYPILSNFREGVNEANIDRFEFRVIKPTDRTIGNKENNIPVVFSFELDNLNSILYDEDASSYRNVSIVASEGEGQERHIIEVGDKEATDIDRIELYVDARDLQPTEEETESKLEERMIQRGEEKLSETIKFISFEGTINSGDKKYIYGKDFFLGDYVSVYSKEINKNFNVQITNVSKSISNGIEYLDVTFGYDRLSIKNIKK